jgi:hypothetical protein
LNRVIPSQAIRGANEVIADGFKYDQPDGAPILVDARVDKHLRMVCADVRRLLEGIPGIKAKTKLLALFVSSRMVRPRPRQARAVRQGV